MKTFLFIVFIFLFPTQSLAKDNFRFTNKIEAAYGKVYIAEKATFKGGKYIKNNISLGIIFKISKNINYKTFYLLENSKKDNWVANHFLGTVFCFKFQ